MSVAAETLGQRLKAERERRGLSPQKVADELHLDGWVVDGLESGNYARVGPAVYVKGHLKRYAGLLGLPAAEILEAYAAEPAEAVVAPPAANLRMRTVEATDGELPWLQAAGFAVAAVIIGGIVWWKPWHARNAAGVPPAAAQTDIPAQRSAAAPTPSPAPPAPVPAPPTTPAMTPATTPAAATRAHSDADATPGSGRARLRLSFSANSWVDVHDAAGLRLFAGDGHANSVKSIAGNAPLRVYLRSASGVQLEINNRAVAIGPQYMVGDMAHFEAGADGVLRRDTHVVAPRPHG